jgi:hypothetical protein
MFWFHLSSCREMSDPKTGAGSPSALASPVHSWKKYKDRRADSCDDRSQCRQLRKKKIQNFLLPFSGSFTLLKDDSALPESSAVGDGQSSFVKKPAEIYCIDLRELI